MYLGHLAAGLVLKSRVREAPLAWLLFATVLSDLVCGVLLALGIERSVVHGPMVFANMESHIEYSHSLLASLGCALLVAAWARVHWRSLRVGVALGLAVLSHYVLDALSHRPDMPVLGFGAAHDITLGTNLALHPLAFFLVELGFCLLAWRLYDGGNRRLLFTILVLMALYTNTVFGFAPPPPPSASLMGGAMIWLFGVSAAIMAWAAKPR
jgi:hypothetical protein